MQLASLQCSSWCAKLCKGLQNASRLITAAAAAQPPTLLLASESSFLKLFFKNVGHTHMSLFKIFKQDYLIFFIFATTFQKDKQVDNYTKYV